MKKFYEVSYLSKDTGDWEALSEHDSEVDARASAREWAEEDPHVIHRVVQVKVIELFQHDSATGLTFKAEGV